MIGLGNRMQIPPVIKNLLIINGLFYFLTIVLMNNPVILNPAKGFLLESNIIYKYLALWHWETNLFQPWQLISHMFLHDAPDPMHIFTNMLALWMFGSPIENRWGSKRFLQYYIFTGVGAALFFMLLSPTVIPMVGASGAVFGILLAFGMLYPNTQIILLIPPMPIKAKYLVIGYGLFSLYMGVSRTGGEVAHLAHVGGLLFGLLFFIYWKIKGIYY
tara:strand:- start:696 stop:1346 length:651 start_codon:yes stop_codon:yes gene_type:complete